MSFKVNQAIPYGFFNHLLKVVSVRMTNDNMCANANVEMVWSRFLIPGLITLNETQLQDLNTNRAAQYHFLKSGSV